MSNPLPSERYENIAENLMLSLERSGNPLQDSVLPEAEFRELCALTETAMLAASALASEPIPAQLKHRLLADATAFLSARRKQLPPD